MVLGIFLVLGGLWFVVRKSGREFKAENNPVYSENQSIILEFITRILSFIKMRGFFLP